MAHTPGPWRVSEEFFAIVDSGNTVIRVCGVSMPAGYVPDDDPAYDNGRLLAAAPELLAALKLILEVYALIPEEHWPDGVREGVAAVAKAECRA